MGHATSQWPSSGMWEQCDDTVRRWAGRFGPGIAVLGERIGTCRGVTWTERRIRGSRNVPFCGTPGRAGKTHRPYCRVGPVALVELDGECCPHILIARHRAGSRNVPVRAIHGTEAVNSDAQGQRRQWGRRGVDEFAGQSGRRAVAVFLKGDVKPGQDPICVLDVAPSN